MSDPETLSDEELKQIAERLEAASRLNSHEVAFIARMLDKIAEGRALNPTDKARLVRMEEKYL